MEVVAGGGPTGGILLEAELMGGRPGPLLGVMGRGEER